LVFNWTRYFTLNISTLFVEGDGLRVDYPVYSHNSGWGDNLQALDLRTHLNKKNRTMYSGTSTYSDTTPTYSDTTLTYSGPTPTYSNTTSTYSDTTLTYSGTTLTYSDTTLTYSDTTLASSDSTSTYNTDCQLEDPREFSFYDYNFIKSKGTWSVVLGIV